jgi:hypothetical protein
MNEDQWNEICRIVLELLKTQSEVKFQALEFFDRFDLNENYYQDMIRHAKATSPGFYFESGWRSVTGDPAESIRFYKPA